MEKKINLLFVINNRIPIKDILTKYGPKFSEFCSYQVVQTLEEYEKLDNKYSHDAICIQHPVIGP